MVCPPTTPPAVHCTVMACPGENVPELGPEIAKVGAAITVSVPATVPPRLPEPAPAGPRPGTTRMQRLAILAAVEALSADDLTDALAIVQALPNLPPAVRAGILAMVKAALS